MKRATVAISEYEWPGLPYMIPIAERKCRYELNYILELQTLQGIP